MSIIPEKNIDEFRCMTEEAVRAMPSTVLLDGEGNYLATLIVPRTDFIKMKVAYMGEMSNWLRPKDEENPKS